jgi:hypothetical protein
MNKHAWNPKAFERAKRHRSSRKGKGHSSLWMWIMVAAVLALAGVALFKFGPPSAREAGASAFEGGVGFVVWIIDGAKGLIKRSRGQSPEELGFERLADSQQESLYAVP